MKARCPVFRLSLPDEKREVEIVQTRGAGKRSVCWFKFSQERFSRRETGYTEIIFSNESPAAAKMEANPECRKWKRRHHDLAIAKQNAIFAGFIDGAASCYRLPTKYQYSDTLPAKKVIASKTEKNPAQKIVKLIPEMPNRIISVSDENSSSDIPGDGIKRKKTGFGKFSSVQKAKTEL